MAYIPNEWKDQVVQRPKTYQMNNNDDGSVTLIDSFGLVTELGTPVNEDYMNHIEQGIAGTAVRKYNTSETFNEGEWVLSENDGKLYKSLVANNKNNPITDETKWQKVSLGGGGLEVGDIGIAALGIDETKGLRRYLNGQIITANANTQGFINKLKSAAVLYPSLVCTETEWQAIAAASVGGQCGKFVINYDDDDTTVISVRLPKIIMPIQGLTDLTKLGELVEAGLPTHAHSATSSSDWTGDHTHWMNGDIPTTATIGDGWRADLGGSDGPFKLYTNTTASSGGHSHVITTAIGDSTDENSIYGNSTTVQQEQPQFPYFIQIATGQETEVNITNDIELNNPFFFGTSQYFVVEPNNLSWLKSNGQYTPKASYPDYYDWILENVNKGVEGFKGQEGYGYVDTSNAMRYWWISSQTPTVGATVYRCIQNSGADVFLPCGTITSLQSNGFSFDAYDEVEDAFTVTRDETKDISIIGLQNWITDYDWGINSANETFKLPLLNGSEHLPSGKITQSGLSGIVSPEEHTANKNGWFYIIQSSTSANNEHIVLYEKSNGRGATSFNNVGWSNRVALFVKRGDTGVFAYNTQSPSVTRNYYFEEAQGNGTLYFYVGETVQNANLINAGRIEEQLASLTTVVETYVNGTSWYRVSSDGWCEQGGLYETTQYARFINTEINLLKPLSSVKIKSACAQDQGSVSTIIVNCDDDVRPVDSNLSSVLLSIERLYDVTTSKPCKVWWEVKGYI